MSYQLQVNAEPSKILYIDSRDANKYLAQKEVLIPDQNGVNQTFILDLTSYFQYQLIEKIEVPLNQRALISLNSATIPYSFYNIRKGINDILRMETTTIATPAVDPIVDFMTIPEGNYTAYTLATFIENFVKNNMTNAGMPFTFKVDYNTDLGKYEYKMSKTTTADAGNKITLTFDFASSSTSPHIEMGFLKGISQDIVLPASTAGTSSNVQVDSVNVVDLNGSIHGVYIRTNLVSNGTLDSQSGTFSNILSRIPLKVNAGGIIFAEPNNATHKSVVDLRSIDILTIRLTDERNRLIDLNGLHYQLAIQIDFIYSERKRPVPMGSLTKNNFGHSFHHEDIKLKNELEDRRTKIKNDDKKKN